MGLCIAIFEEVHGSSLKNMFVSTLILGFSHKTKIYNTATGMWLLTSLLTLIYCLLVHYVSQMKRALEMRYGHVGWIELAQGLSQWWWAFMAQSFNC
jgi:hypothetical protein